MRNRSRHVVAVVGRIAAAAACASGAGLALSALGGGSGVGGATPLAGASQLVKHTCSARQVSGSRIPDLKIATSGAGRLPTVAVCIDGKGPYPFLVSTGAGSSVVTPALARSLHLRKGAKAAIRGVTCVTSSPSAKVSKWSMSGLRLAPQTLLVAKVPGTQLSPAPRGIIGSDVLSRFGAVRIDYRAGHMLLAGKEGSARKGNLYILGQAKTALPAGLAAGTAVLGASLRVFESPQGTIVAAPVKIAGHTEQLSVDTGSGGSGLLPAVAKSLKLVAGGQKVGFSGVGCRGEGPTYSSGTWSLAGASLQSAPLVARPIAGSVNAGLQGVLGSNVLSADGSVIVDYDGAHLWLVKG
jgi:hypothetical protein